MSWLDTWIIPSTWSNSSESRRRISLTAHNFPLTTFFLSHFSLNINFYAAWFSHFPALRLAEVEICEKMGGAYPIRYKSLPSLRLPLIFVYNSVEFASRSVCRSITLKLWRKNIQFKKEEKKKHRRVHLLIKPRRHKSSWFNLDSWSNKFHTWKKERKRKVIVDKLRKKDNFSTKKKIEKRKEKSEVES